MEKRVKRIGFSKEARAWWMFELPAFIIIGVLAIYPLCHMIYLSFFKYVLSSGQPPRFDNFSNYIKLVTDPRFLNSMVVSMRYTVIGVTGTMILGFTMALLLNTNGIIVKFLRGIALIPMLICSVALAVAWQLMYNPNYGVFNMVLGAVGIAPQNWLGDPKITIYMLILIEIWQCTPFVMILTLAGFQGISTDYYEAAAIDGASKFQSLIHITIPLMRNVLLTILIMRLIDAFKVFEKPKIMTDGMPIQTTETISLFVYKTAFSQWDFGYGSAGSLVIAGIIAIFAIIIVKIASNE